MESIDPYLQNNGTFQVVYALSELASGAGVNGVLVATRKVNLTGTYKLQLIGFQLQGRPTYGKQTVSTLPDPGDNYLSNHGITVGGISPLYTNSYAFQIASPQFVSVANMTPDLQGFVVIPQINDTINILPSQVHTNNTAPLIDVSIKPNAQMGNTLGNVITTNFSNNQINIAVYAGNSATNGSYNWNASLFDACGGSFMRDPTNPQGTYTTVFEGNLLLTFQYQKIR